MNNQMQQYVALAVMSDLTMNHQYNIDCDEWSHIDDNTLHCVQQYFACYPL